MSSLLARASITCYSFHAVCITDDRIRLSVSSVQECAQPYLHSGHAPYYMKPPILEYCTLKNAFIFFQAVTFAVAAAPNPTAAAAATLGRRLRPLRPRTRQTCCRGRVLPSR
jgi:hypothetical protein